jgi:hypothetical protein
MQSTVRVSNIAIIKTVGISFYADQALPVPLTQINWGALEPGQTENFTGYAKNTANVPVTLSWVTENWNPAAAQPGINVSWDYTNAPINPNVAVKLVFSLRVSNTITGITNSACYEALHQNKSD